MSELFERYRGRLKKMVRARLNRQLYGRVDESDVVQDAFLDAARRLNDYASDPRAPFFLWLRKITGQRLMDVHRRHLGVQGRDARVEVSLHQGQAPLASSILLAKALLGGLTSPTQAAVKAETRLAIQEALASMSDVDREILSMRHLESLSNVEAAQELGIDSSAASKRYLRALQRLKVILENLGVVE
ncbi:MAG: sigma-70 family RNA polymerase sigma factor [Pirellulales bacterium]|nr:sigma-70 family RNA polymerase sigma factor [Pirellulales bacterium]